MKLILFYTKHFSFQSADKGLPDLPDIDCGDSIEQAVVVFFHVETEDEERRSKVIQKFVKNTKWLAGKFATKNVVLHSFNHLSMSKASPDFSLSVRDAAVARLENADYRVLCTPFGYFNEFTMHVAGDSLAKVYKEF